MRLYPAPTWGQARRRRRLDLVYAQIRQWIRSGPPEGPFLGSRRSNRPLPLRRFRGSALCKFSQATSAETVLPSSVDRQPLTWRGTEDRLGHAAVDEPRGSCKTPRHEGWRSPPGTARPAPARRPRARPSRAVAIPRRLQSGSTNTSSSSTVPPGSAAQVAKPTTEPSSSATYRGALGQSLRSQDQVLRVCQQVVTVACVGQRSPAIDTGACLWVSGGSEPDRCHLSGFVSIQQLAGRAGRRVPRG